MEYYCENCGHVSNFGDFCFNCESPNMIPMNQPKNGHTPEIAEKITNRNNDQSLDQIAQRLAANVATNPGENPGEMKITLGGFYYRKYGEYDVNYRVNGSTCSLCLVEIPLSMRDTFPECREARRMAIVELDRMLKTHYQMEALLKEILPNQTPEIAEKIRELLNVRGDK